TPLNIQANTTYVVSVNSNTYYAFTSNGLGTTLTNGDLSAVADGSNGVYDLTPGSFPAQSYQNSNYFRDVVFAPTVSNPNNKPGTVAISGVTAQGNTLTANIADPDGLTRVSITYTWQQSSNGTTWQNITGATNQTLTLDSSLIGQQVRVNATYTDAIGGSENILSLASSPISALLESIFTSTTTPSQPNFTDGPGVDYELGMKFTSTKAGQIQAIRYYKSPSEIGTHVGRIWSSTGTLLASVTFTNETASGWQQQALSTPVTIPANTTYVVSVNTNGYYTDTPNGFATAITNGDLTAPVGAGVYNETISAFPSQVYQNENYFRDIVFAPTAPNPNNKPGTVSIGGTATQNQTLTANVADADGLTGVTINYQWQQSSNGTTWTNITGATNQTLALAQALVNQQVRVRATYTDALGSTENPLSTATSAVVNVNDLGTVILKGSATIGYTLDETVFDNDGLIGVNINYQWQQLTNSIWTNIAGSIAKSLTLTTALLGQQVRVLASYIDNLGSSENVASAGVTVAAQNAIVLENQKTGTTAWQISNLASNNEIAGYGDATSINKGQAINFKVSLAQAGQYQIDVYRLGYYGGTGGRFVTSITGLNGVVQAGPTTDPNTRLVEYKWNNSYTLQTGNDWTTGLYLAKLTDSRTDKQTYVQFVLRDDNRPADIGFQDSVSTTEAYNNYGGYSVYDANSSGGQRAYQVSFDRPLAAANLGLTNTDGYNTNNMLAWEYNMVRWQESQGYDVSYFTNIDTSINPLQLYSQNVFQVTGHDEYWSMDMMNNVTNARDKGINLAFFSANTAYWQVRFEPSSSGQANRVMTVYKDTSGIGISGDSLDPVTVTNPSAATTLFRSSQVNRPENALMGVGYLSDTPNIYSGYDFVVSNALDPYYANTGLKNGDKLRGLVGYEWDGLLNNGFAPPGLVVLSQSPVQAGTVLPPLPSGTNPNISNAVRYTAASGAKVFSTGSVQWVWGLDSDNVIDPRVDIRAQQITVNVLKDMGAKPKTPSSGIVV
ncbi:N,N-dimethylformamidase beta subunit family domain-containing protein, partial [Dolichospermum circinale]|uniref:N,N-dimethylformamidase beta subunit family domain-containing protein n=1 Tax=Dolichospermum circinale TaxID=109265 RepID=UPI00232E2807